MYAIVENGIVTNTIVWDGESEWVPPEGVSVVEVPSDTVAGPGFSYSGGKFVAPTSTA
jgi:hypothetical protein